RLTASEEVADLLTKGGVSGVDGKKQGSKRKLISLVDETNDSDIEITPPTQTTKPHRRTTFGTATRKPMLQSTIDGGIGSSAQACSKEKFVPMKSSQKKKTAPTQSQKKKEKVTEDITDFDDELGEEGVDEDVIGEEEREERQISHMWVDFKVNQWVEKASFEM
ncbi:hypothetical protein HID58_087752, partial [Brassica napus]